MKMSPQRKSELDRLHLFLQENENKLQAIDQAAMHLHRRSLPLEKALLAYEKYLASMPASPIAAYNYAWYLTRDGQFESAIRMYQQALELGIDSPEEVHINIGNIYMDHLLDTVKARQAFDMALSANPGYFGAYHNLGNLEEQSGDREQAAACFRRCLEIEPDNHSALARLADTQRFRKDDDPLLSRMKAAAAKSENSDLHFALGSAFNQLGEFDSAWAHLSRANALDRASLPAYKPGETEAVFDQIIARTSRDWLDQFQEPSRRDVFICGMFRTGSTLLEQMLAAHPAFTAVGESEFFPRLVLREFDEFPQGLDEIDVNDTRVWQERHSKYAERLEGNATRLTDKRPDNFQYIGLIKAVMPSARFIVTERDWRDVALSIYSMRLGAGQNYATDLASIRHYIGQQRRLVDYWQTLLGDDLLRLRYEELVTQPQKTLGRALTTLGEPWDDRCLAFDKLDKPVKTGSVWQVREPLHARSVGRWKYYRPYFESVFGASLNDPAA